MAISLVGTSGNNGGSPTIVLTLPGGISAGNVVFAAATCSNTQTMTAPAGWTIAAGWPKDGGSCRMYLWTKNTVASTDSSTTHTFTNSAGNKTCIVSVVLSSTNGFPASYFDGTPAHTAHTVTGTSYIAPSSTSSTAGAYGIALFAVRGTDPTTWTPAGGLTERQDLGGGLTGSAGQTALHLCDSAGSVGGAGTVWGGFTETNISAAAGGGVTLLVKENASGGGGNPTITEHPGSAASATGATASGFTTAAGVTLVAWVARSGGLGTGALTGVTDSAGNTWGMLTRGAVNAVTNTRLEVWSTTTAAAVTSVTFASSTAQTWGWNILEIAGLASGTVLDVASPDNSAQASSTTITTPTVATGNATDLVLAGFHSSAATATLTTGVGWVGLTAFDDGSNPARLARLDVAATGSYAAAWTLSTAQAAGVATVAFKAAGTGGGGGGGGTGTSYPKIGLWRQHPADAGSWRQTMNAAESTYGLFQGHWAEYHPAGNLPLNAAELQAAADGKRLHVFWKPYPAGQGWAYTAAGSYNATIDQVAASIRSITPTPIWLTLHHEPENDLGVAGTAANYRAMWAKVRERFDLAGVTNVTWVMVYMNSHAHPTDMPGLWPGDSLVDVISQQDYITCSTTAGQQAAKFIEDLDYLEANADAAATPPRAGWQAVSSGGKPRAWTEWGADLGGDLGDCGVAGGQRGTVAHRGAAIDGVTAILSTLASRGVVELRYFDARSDWITDPPAADGTAFAALKAASEAGQVGGTPSGGGPGPITASGFSLANDGSTALTQSISFTLPAGWAAGDYASAWISANSNPTMVTEPTGWTLEEGPVANGSVQKAWRYSRRLVAGDLNPTWTISQSVRPVGVLGTWSGVDPTTPVHVLGPLAGNGITAATGQQVSAITTTAAEAVLVTTWLGRWADGTGSPHYATVPASHTAGGSAGVSSGAGNPGSGALAATLTANPIAAGTYGPYTATWPVAVTGINGQLALLPAATTPPPPPPPPPDDVGITIADAVPKIVVLAGLGANTASDAFGAANLKLGQGPGLGTGTLGGLDWTDISADLLGVEITRTAKDLEGAQIATATIDLDNRKGYYDASNPNGPYFGFLDLGVPVWVRMVWDEVVFERFYGFLDADPMDIGWEPTVSWSCTDALETLGRAKVGPIASSFDGDLSGTRVHRILDAAAWPDSMRSIDTGRIQLAPTVYDDQALALLQNVLDTEYGQLGTDGAGRVVFFDRYHLGTNARSVTVQADFADDLLDANSSLDVEMAGLEVGRSRDLLYNQAAVTRNGGVEQTFNDLPSQAKYGVRTVPGSFGELLRTDADALSMAQFLVGRLKAQPLLSVSKVSVEAIAQQLWSVLLPLRLGDRVRVTRDYGPNTIVAQLLIQSVTETITAGDHPSWDYTFETTNPSSLNPMVLGVGPGLGIGQLG